MERTSAIAIDISHFLTALDIVCWIIFFFIFAGLVGLKLHWLFFYKCRSVRRYIEESFQDNFRSTLPNGSFYDTHSIHGEIAGKTLKEPTYKISHHNKLWTIYLRLLQSSYRSVLFLDQRLTLHAVSMDIPLTMLSM